MSKLFKFLISLIVVCLSCIAFFACGGTTTPSESVGGESESIIVSSESEPASEPESESEEENESSFVVELPEVDRM
jgi:hypothetical protein